MTKRFVKLLTFGALVLSGAAFGADVALVNGLLYASPSAAPITNGAVLIHDGRILAFGSRSEVAVPARARIIDLRGATVTAGFWNSHVHLMTQRLLNAGSRSNAELSDELSQMLTRWGFTTVFDTASQLSNTSVIRHRVASGEVIGPMVLTVGDPFYPTGGTPVYVRKFLADNGFPNDEIKDLPSALARARRQIQHGADGVKLFAGAIVGGDIGVLAMPLDQARALVAVAHKMGKPAFAHPSNLEGLNIAIDSGVDVLAHTTPMTGPWSPELARRIQAHGMALIPTLTLFEVEAKKFGESDEDALHDMDAAVQQVEAFSRIGGQVLFGTDCGYTDVYDTTEEYRLLGRALDWRQILGTLTMAPAQRFGFAARKGRIARGMDADLVVLEGDPAKDITAFARVRMTIRAGRPIFEAPGR